MTHYRQIKDLTESMIHRMDSAQHWFLQLKRKYGEDEPLVKEAEPWFKDMDKLLIDQIDIDTHARRNDD